MICNKANAISHLKIWVLLLPKFFKDKNACGAVACVCLLCIFILSLWPRDAVCGQTAVISFFIPMIERKGYVIHQQQHQLSFSRDTFSKSMVWAIYLIARPSHYTYHRRRLLTHYDVYIDNQKFRTHKTPLDCNRTRLRTIYGIKIKIYIWPNTSLEDPRDPFMREFWRFIVWSLIFKWY